MRSDVNSTKGAMTSEGAIRLYQEMKVKQGAGLKQEVKYQNIFLKEHEGSSLDCAWICSFYRLVELQPDSLIKKSILHVAK